MARQPMTEGEHDRYRAVGLARNPFSIDVHDSDAGIIDNSWFVDRGIPNPPPPGSLTLVQLIGEQGVGKSTHLHHWRLTCPGPYHYVPCQPYHRRWGHGPRGALVYGDEIDRMPVPLRALWFRRLRRLEATVVIGTHRDLTAAGRRAGFEVKTHRLGPVDRDQLAEVLRRRIAAVALPETTDGEGRAMHTHLHFNAEDITQILQESGGNLRMADTVCHRLVAQRVAQISRR